MSSLDWVSEALRDYTTGELTTIGSKGTPVTFPVAACFDEDRGVVITTTSVAFANKADNIRREPRVAIFFGYMPAITSKAPAMIHVQGTAKVIDDDFARNMATLARYPKMAQMPGLLRRHLRHRIFQRLYQMYLTRIIIEITPKQVLAWRDREASSPPEVFPREQVTNE